MASLTEIRKAIGEHITAETSLHCYPHLPATVHPPCAYVEPIDQIRETAGRAFVTYRFNVVVITGIPDNVAAAESLDRFLSTSTDDSITAAFDDQTALGLENTNSNCPGWDNYGIRSWEDGGHFLAADVQIEVHTPK